ncbi:PP2C family protein-serine/threonine phosphatase [Aquibacillus sediminis]|uniref:PP2C family protein-serine/threonine phosphatase n=1 Tax=Aquibacillus sediminis TaxID=2574734 RepID=UPI001109FC83|nr:PP2C family protein-serine/threonine phosphatase [Aquibacillus sediminis]
MYRNNLKYDHVKSEQEDGGVSKTLKREINLAKNIQSTLLNGNTPEIDGGEVVGSSLPARLIGGDYYDFYPLVNGKVRIVIGDVMGKGIPAAMLMILTRGAFRTAAESTRSPGATLTSMNHALYKDLRKLRSFVTLFCADWDPDTGILTYANAGHNAPLYINDKNKEVVTLNDVSGVMVGGLPNQTYNEGSIELGNNDIVFFYTDGIVEAQNSSGEQYQMDRLMETLDTHREKNVNAIQDEVIKSIHHFTNGEPQRDDITMVLLKVNSEHSDITSYNMPVIDS